MSLTSLKNEVDAARELLAQAEENYKKGILEAAQNGELAERKTARWREVYCTADSKTRFFCDGCGYYAPLQSDFCPKCGAKMANPQHYAPKQAAAWIHDTAQITLSEPEHEDDTEQIVSREKWFGMGEDEKQHLVLSEFNRLIRKHGSLSDASRALGKSRSYIGIQRYNITVKGVVPYYSTYKVLATH